jgi:hypothetical protein
MKIIQFTLLLLCGCAEESPCIAEPCNGNNTFIVVQSDYATGVLQGFNQRWDQVTSEAPADGDAHLVAEPRGLTLLQRGRADNMIQLSADLTITAQRNLPSNSNPHDAIHVGDELWISLYQSPYIARFKGDLELDPIDLSPWTDSDGRPEAHRFLKISDQIILLSIQNLDFTGVEPRQPDTSFLLVLNGLTARVERSIPVPANPFGTMHHLGENRVAIACNGDWSINPNAGIWIANLNDDSGSFLIRETELGGTILDLEYFENNFYVVVANDDFSTPLYAVDAQTATRSTDYNIAKHPLGCIEVIDTELAVCDRSPGRFGVRIVDQHNQSINTKLVPTRLPPTQVIHLGP